MQRHIINEAILPRPEVLYITVRNKASTSLNGIVLIGDSVMPLPFIETRNLKFFLGIEVFSFPSNETCTVIQPINRH